MADKQITFTKMHGCKNDYLYIDCTKNELENPAEVSIKLSDRHTGIGSDGIILICESKVINIFAHTADAVSAHFSL